MLTVTAPAPPPPAMTLYVIELGLFTPSHGLWEVMWQITATRLAAAVWTVKE